MKDSKIFFLIEHQNKIDYNMPLRIEEYKKGIIESAMEHGKIASREDEIPKVIPIVLYTGKKRWDAKTSINYIEDKRFRHLNLSEYIVIDISKYTEEELKKSNNLIDKIFLMEKTKNVQEAVNVVKELKKIATNLSTSEKKKLSLVIEGVLEEKLNKEQVKEIIKKLEREDEDMLACIEMVREENKRIKEEGIMLGRNKEKIEIAIEMKKNNIATELIEKITGLKKEKIEKMKV